MNTQMLKARYCALFDSERPGPTTFDIADGSEINPDLLAQRAADPSCSSEM